MALLMILSKMIGSLGFILYGMKIMSDGIQKSANKSVQKALNLMTGNRFLAVLTGIIVTGLVQSSGATTVMTVSFVNAGLLTLEQAIGLIFGANIGTTVTAWIVSIVGKFSLSSFALPSFGLGYFLHFFKRLRCENIGDAIMGFALLFIGLDWLTQIAPSITQEHLSFVGILKKTGVSAVSIGISLGLILTVILHSSSGTTAVVIAMAQSNVIGWEFAAASILGSNIGSTVDAILASIGSRLNARRAATVHVLFNVAGSIIALLCFHFSLQAIDYFTPGGPSTQNIAFRIAIYHTLFNVLNTIIALPFINPIARFVRFIIKPKEHEAEDEKYGVYIFPFQTPSMKENISSYIVAAEHEIVKMSSIMCKMFSTLRGVLKEKKTSSFSKTEKYLAEKEDYVDQMQDELSEYLVSSLGLSLSEKERVKVRLMLGIVDNLENITDEIYEIVLFITKKNSRLEKQISEKNMKELVSYTDFVDEFIRFVHAHLNSPMSPEEFQKAIEMENKIDQIRSDLKTLASHQLEEGAAVKTELLYIDIVRNIEKIGDFAFSISKALSQLYVE
ncbi:MAG: Na/Pi cotransporter family protein [Treponema sp.]